MEVPRELYGELLSLIGPRVTAFEAGRKHIEKIVTVEHEGQLKRKSDHLLRIIQDECRCLKCRPKVQHLIKTSWTKGGNHLYSTEVGERVAISGFCPGVKSRLSKLDDGNVGFMLPIHKPHLTQESTSKQPKEKQIKTDKIKKTKGTSGFAMMKRIQTEITSKPKINSIPKAAKTSEAAKLVPKLTNEVANHFLKNAECMKDFIKMYAFKDKLPESHKRKIPKGWYCYVSTEQAIYQSCKHRGIEMFPFLIKTNIPSVDSLVEIRQIHPTIIQCLETPQQ
jgi:hypothetical protein